MQCGKLPRIKKHKIQIYLVKKHNCSTMKTDYAQHILTIPRQFVPDQYHIISIVIPEFNTYFEKVLHEDTID